VYLESDGKVFVLYPESFPFRKADQYILPSLGKSFSVCILLSVLFHVASNI
jgi:hypothetical protein